MISIKVKADGLTELRKEFIEARSQANQIVEDMLEGYLEGFLLERIRLNTPILSADLRKDLRIQKIQARAGKASFMIVSKKSYALKVHEDTYQLGARSKEQASQPEGGVGNKYIERVVHYHADALKKLLGGFPSILIRKAFPSGRVRLIRRD